MRQLDFPRIARRAGCAQYHSRLIRLNSRPDTAEQLIDVRSIQADFLMHRHLDNRHIVTDGEHLQFLSRRRILIIIRYDEHPSARMHEVVRDTIDEPFRIDQHRLGAGEDRPPKCHIPVRAIFAEDGDFIADLNASGLNQPHGKISRPCSQLLEGEGFSVWWDRQIRTGASFDREIEQELASASCVVVVWSRSSIDSDWVREEAGEEVSAGPAPASPAGRKVGS